MCAVDMCYVYVSEESLEEVPQLVSPPRQMIGAVERQGRPSDDLYAVYDLPLGCLSGRLLAITVTLCLFLTGLSAVDLTTYSTTPMCG